MISKFDCVAIIFGIISCIIFQFYTGIYDPFIYSKSGVLFLYCVLVPIIVSTIGFFIGYFGGKLIIKRMGYNV